MQDVFALNCSVLFSGSANTFSFFKKRNAAMIYPFPQLQDFNSTQTYHRFCRLQTRDPPIERMFPSICLQLLTPQLYGRYGKEMAVDRLLPTGNAILNRIGGRKCCQATDYFGQLVGFSS